MGKDRLEKEPIEGIVKLRPVHDRPPSTADGVETSWQ